MCLEIYDISFEEIGKNDVKNSPGEKVRRKIVSDQIRYDAYKIFRKILRQDLIMSYRTVFLKILSDSDRKMSSKNLTIFEHQESYKILYKDSCQILSDRLRSLR